jgi:membrane-associated protease RseP (regulator of RpoE activity)
MDPDLALPKPVRVRRASFFAKDRNWLNGLLLALTIGTTFLVGVDWSAGFYGPAAGGGPARPFREPRVLLLAAAYTAVLLIILGAHEMGHYRACRRNGLSATLPFFIPAPTLIGTMGAFIRIRSPITDRRTLFDVGASGPLAGFALAIPALAIGLALSRIVPALPPGQSIVFGEPLLVKILGALILGPVAAGSDVLLHPLAFAGWVGLLVTAMNLFPIGQLDGGHVLYALAGRRARIAGWSFLVLLTALGVFFWAGWLLWALLVFLVIRTKHPPLWDETSPLGRKRLILSILLLAVFLLSFTPAPIKGYDLLSLIRQF